MGAGRGKHKRLQGKAQPNNQGRPLKPLTIKEKLLNKTTLKKAIDATDCIKDALIYLDILPNTTNYRIFHDACDQHNLTPKKLQTYNRRGGVTPRPLSEFLVLNGPEIKSTVLRTRLLDKGLLQDVCYICKQRNVWNNKAITLQLDHINGNRFDNRLKNLRILCPNCHAQTETHSGKNNIKSQKKNYCPDCSKEIHRQSTRCGSCATKEWHKSKIKWPSKSRLLKMLARSNYTQVSKALGVSDNAIRKHLKSLDNNG